ncbi:lytic transglycosylase domain-containing protein [uncultured Bradyrhizobium sp.]|uniref:lytic transglycosylase domain-containing protein n=1 Tax=uncultured Bradyrhizobium sp. TaxID=199684 RepID=UPI00261EF094|nr:lytic transglycosylase domain-containing protein [uncultured Bradyrhizobium sp.]
MQLMRCPGLLRTSSLAGIALLVAGSAVVGTPKSQAAPSDAIGELLSSTATTASSGGVGATSRGRPATSKSASRPKADAPASAGLASLKETIRLARQGRVKLALERSERIGDRAGRDLAVWVILRSNDDAIGFKRYASFVRTNPSWPGHDVFRRRAEARLWFEQHDAGTVLAFFSQREPLGPLGKLALARALAERGNQAAARKYVRSAWHEGSLSAASEAQVLARFGHFLGAADHRARMDSRLYADDISGAMRAANRLAPADRAIVNARAAVIGNAKSSGALLDAASAAAGADSALLFTRIQWLRRNDRIAEAARLLLSADRRISVADHADAWWSERRVLVRRLLDAGRAQTAYQIARDAAPPSRESFRIDHSFTAGWIALRFLNDPDLAARHFARIPAITTHPTSLARAAYWLGRAAEAGGHGKKARDYYAAASKRGAAYYGQLAGARLGRREVSLSQSPSPGARERARLSRNDLVRAVELLYATGNSDLVIPFVADVGRTADVGLLTLVAETVAKRRDAPATLAIGKSALARGFALERYAFPDFGLPSHASVGPKAAASLVYAVARAESAFDRRARSAANASGLMQVTPAAGRTIARRLGIAFDPGRLHADPAYNVQLGSAELADLLKTYDGNHVLALVGYNAGRGRVKRWIARYGDPRDPSVDVVDWVERIPFTETRIYVQRVMENLQAYRSRFGERAPPGLEVDMRGTRR